MTHYLKTLIESLERARERKFLRDAERAMSACACNAAPAESTREDDATHAERLEHIALYARAGYFNMGYTVDAFQVPNDSPLH